MEQLPFSNPTKDGTTDFCNIVLDRIKDFSPKQLVFFVWLCAVRALPFLGTQRSFSFWRREDIQTHLFSLLWATDVVCNGNSFDDAYTSATNAVKVAKATASDAHAAYSAIYAVAYAADTANFSAYDMDSAMYAAKSAASIVDAATTQKQIFEIIIFNDIDAIKTHRLSTLNNDIHVYGEVWYSFLYNLTEIGCSYWSNLYINLFTNKFVIDTADFQRRLTVPDEIKALGAATVGRYLNGLNDSTEHLNEARIIILGEKGAGKTSIARKLVDINMPMPRMEESTECVSVLMWRLPDENSDDGINVHIWDFAGHAITHSAHRCFMSSRCLYIYVYNGRIEHDNRPDYWLEQIRIYGGDSPILFLINEKDGHKSDVPKKKLKYDYPSIIGYYSVDIGDEDKSVLENFRQTVADILRNNPSWKRQEIPTDVYCVKEDLCTCFNSGKRDVISRDEFDNIALNNGISSERHDRILADLHSLGICLWYNTEDMLEFNTLVLNPEWITTGIYSIINWGFNSERHILSLDDVTEYFVNKETKTRYPRDKVWFLFRLMRVYELAFFVAERSLFLPILLPLDMPDKLPIFPNNDRLIMSFVVGKVLPPNIVSRIIVRRHEEIYDQKELWRKGAILHFREGNAVALITEEARSILVRVKGTDKTQYIMSLRTTINDIFSSYRTITPDLFYEVIVPEDLNENRALYAPITLMRDNSSLMLSESTIKAHTKNEWPYLDPTSEMLIPLMATARAYNMNINLFMKENIIGDPDDTVSYSDSISKCMTNFQRELNVLANDFELVGLNNIAENVNNVEDAIGKAKKIMMNASDCDNHKEKMTEQGVISTTKQFISAITDNSSEIYTETTKLRNGASIIQKLLENYNELSKLLPFLPQISNGILDAAERTMDGFKTPEFKEVDNRLRKAVKDTEETVYVSIRERMDRHDK